MTNETLWANTGDIGALLHLEAVGETRFRNRVNDANIQGALYGGQVLAQALRAAQLTVAPGRAVHSLHAYFIRAGNTASLVDYAVETTRDGGSFSTRRVTASQGGQDILHLGASFQDEGQDGFDYETGPRTAMTPPEALATVADVIARYPDEITPTMRERLTSYRTLEVRPTEPQRLLARQRHSHIANWLRIPSAAGLPPDLQACALAYASDSWLAPATRLPHASVLDLGPFQVASLDHAMWFLRPVRLDEWLLYETESPWTGAGRGLARGSMFDRNGRIVAAVAQEALLRASRKSGPGAA